MKEKIAFVTGANKGIGVGIVKNLGLTGWKVIVGARHQGRAEKAMDELKALGIDTLGWVNIELADLDSIEKAAREVNERFPGVSLLVNNAGIPGDMGVDSQRTDIKDIKETLDVNFIGTFALTKALMPLLIQNNGKIVNVTVPSAFTTGDCTLALWKSFSCASADTAHIAQKAIAKNVLFIFFVISLLRYSGISLTSLTGSSLRRASSRR